MWTLGSFSLCAKNTHAEANNGTLFLKFSVFLAKKMFSSVNEYFSGSQGLKLKGVFFNLTVVTDIKISSEKSYHKRKENTRKIKKMVFCYQYCSDLLWEKKCSSGWEKLLKFEAEDWEFAKFLRALEQFIQTVKVQDNFW